MQHFPIETNLTKRTTSYTCVCFELHAFKVIDNLSQVIDFYWSINNVWHVSGSAMVGGMLLKWGWFSGRWFFSLLSPPPSRPSTRPRPSRANPRWRPHYEFRFFRPSNRLRAGYHLAASLFAMEDIFNKTVNMKETDTNQLPCTSKPCTWNVPKKRKQEPSTIQGVNFQKHVYGKKSKAPRAPTPPVAVSQSVNDFESIFEKIKNTETFVNCFFPFMKCGRASLAPTEASSSCIVKPLLAITRSPLFKCCK